ncbi:MAG: hypothetical protein GXY58_11645 [Planctomycetaceae bacterium]|nr:hypothetical protein [Planctomycetaceae bacterium]
MRTGHTVLLCLFFEAGMVSTVFSAVDEVKLIRTFTDGNKSETVSKLERMDESTYRLKIPIERIAGEPEAWKTSWQTLDYIDIINGDATARKNDAGYWVLADGRLGTFKADSGTIIERRNPLPIYGVKKGAVAFVGIIKGLRYEFSTVVDVQDGNYRIFPRFHIKSIGTIPYEDLVIDFQYFHGEDADYPSMAKAYRKYQLDRGEVIPLKERVKNNPRLEYTADTMFLRLAMASFMRDSDLGTHRGEHWREEDDPPIQTFRDYDNVMRTMRTFKALGIDRADICLVNWNWRSNGRNPICSIAEPELGGDAKCKEATACAHELGYQIMPHILHTENYTISPAFCKEDLALQQDATYRDAGLSMGGRGFSPCFKQVFKKHLNENYDRMAALGFSEPLHIDVTSCIVPYQCFDLNHFCTRRDTAYWMNKVGEVTDERFGGFTSEGPCDHVANTLDYALYVSAYPSYLGKANPLMDRCIPLWQLVYHGIILSNPFASTIDYPYDHARGWEPTTSFTHDTRRLKLVEFGGRPTFYWALSGTEDFAPVKKAYDEYQPLKHLQYEFMEDHTEISTDVFVTVYSSGDEVLTNYSDAPYEYKGKTVGPRDFKLFQASTSR